jgi:hypothetical protein
LIAIDALTCTAEAKIEGDIRAAGLACAVAKSREDTTTTRDFETIGVIYL